MNRVIKFRAWDFVNKQFLNNEFLISTTKGGSIEVCGVSRQNDSSLINEDIIFLQFTGLHDKNGKEIYEGDICKYYNKYNEFCYTRVVKYCPMLACFGLYPNMEEVWQYESDWLKISEVEVIGNIYENPELL